MITLSKAFKLCRISRESVYLRAATDELYRDYYFWSDKLVKTVDMKKIKVVRVAPRFDRYSSDVDGMLFVVRGITAEQLGKLSHKCAMRD